MGVYKYIIQLKADCEMLPCLWAPIALLISVLTELIVKPLVIMAKHLAIMVKPLAIMVKHLAIMVKPLAIMVKHLVIMVKPLAIMVKSI
jgi:hypothetical protein